MPFGAETARSRGTLVEVNGGPVSWCVKENQKDAVRCSDLPKGTLKYKIKRQPVGMSTKSRPKLGKTKGTKSRKIGLRQVSVSPF